MGCRARVLMWGLFVGAAAAALAPAGPGALIPLKMAIASADSVGNDVYVAVVVEFGSGSSMSTVTKCVPVASDAHDSDALAAAVGTSNVAYAASGLLCAIDNYPANGVQNCGESVGSGDYDYWSYWHGSTGSWVYASDGPGEQPVSSPGDDVEGWKFQLNEPDNPTDPPPTVTPSYSQICNASTEVPPPQAPSAPASATTTTTAATPTTAAPTTGATIPGSGKAVPPTSAVNTRSNSGSATTTTTTATGSSRTTTTTVPIGGAGATVRGAHGSASKRSPAASATASDSSHGGSSSNLLPIIVIVAVVAALGGFALFRWRRRPVEE